MKKPPPASIPSPPKKPPVNKKPGFENDRDGQAGHDQNQRPLQRGGRYQ